MSLRLCLGTGVAVAAVTTLAFSAERPSRGQGPQLRRQVRSLDSSAPV
jgi:hypothetical protein